MPNEIETNAAEKMGKSIDSYSHAIAKLRVSATPSLLNHVTVDNYGSEVPLSHVASIATEDARTLAINVWDAGMVTKVEKAIMTSDLGLHPASHGKLIRIILPQLTTERREQIAKMAKAEGEKAKIAVRQVRREANDMVKDQLKGKELTEDDAKSLEANIQKLTDKMIAKIDELAAKKRDDITSF